MEAVTRWLKVLTKRVDVLEKDSADGLDNDQVNAAIADDPAATRLALGAAESLIPHVVSFRRSGVLTLTNSDWTVIPLDDVQFDTGGMANLSSGKIECQRAGWYQLTVSGTLKNPTGPIGRVVFLAALERSDAYHLEYALWVEQDGLSGYTTVTASAPYYLNAGDLLRFQAFQNSGGGVQVEESADYQRPLIALSEISPKEVPTIVPLMSRQVVGFGDSQTAGTMIVNGGASMVWGEWLTSDFVNHGHSGVSAVGFATTYASEITGSANINADCVVELGTNDLGYNVGGDIEALADSIEEVLDAARPLYRSITWIVPGPSVIPAYANAAGYEADRQALITEMVGRGITGLHIARTDLDSDIGQAADARNRVWYMDGLHWSPLAQQRVAQIVFSVLT